MKLSTDIRCVNAVTTAKPNQKEAAIKSEKKPGDPERGWWLLYTAAN